MLTNKDIARELEKLELASVFCTFVLVKQVRRVPGTRVRAARHSALSVVLSVVWFATGGHQHCMCQYLYFCTSKARKLSYLVRDRGSASLAGVSICTFVLVKARKLSYLVRERGGASLALGARAGEPPEQAQWFSLCCRHRGLVSAHSLYGTITSDLSPHTCCRGLVSAAGRGLVGALSIYRRCSECWCTTCIREHT